MQYNVNEEGGLMKKYFITLVVAVMLVASGCSCSIATDNAENSSNATDNATNTSNTTNVNRENSSMTTQNTTYKQISQEEAKEMMKRNDNHIIVDVRRQDEYDGGHIAGAILIPNENIGTTRPEQLKDLNQTILVYCRTGKRSKQVAQKLADMGYTNVYEFGGINTWDGEIVQ